MPDYQIEDDVPEPTLVAFGSLIGGDTFHFNAKLHEKADPFVTASDGTNLVAFNLTDHTFVKDAGPGALTPSTQVAPEKTRVIVWVPPAS